MFVLVASGSVTGLYTLTATTDAVISATLRSARYRQRRKRRCLGDVFVSGAERPGRTLIESEGPDELKLVTELCVR